MSDNKEEQIDTKKEQVEEKPIETKPVVEEKKEEEEVSKKREREETEDVKDTKKELNATTPEEDKERKTKKMKTETSEEEEEPVKETKPKFVFGAATSFGSGFKVSEPINNDKVVEKDVKEMSASKPFAFGSKFSFGSGFGILKEKKDEKETTTDETKNTESDVKKDSTDSSSAIKDTIEEPKHQEIKLHKQDVKSGEEAETCLFQANMKLYQLHNIKEGWKERGVGALKLNKNEQTNKSRIIMRSRGVLTVILNLPLIKGFSVKKGFPGSLQSEKFLRIIALDDGETPKPVTYALKSGNPDLINELYDKITELI